MTQKREPPSVGMILLCLGIGTSGLGLLVILVQNPEVLLLLGLLFATVGLYWPDGATHDDDTVRTTDPDEDQQGQ
jgi:hypothetical protein